MAGQPLVGRHEELAVLLGALESARAGAGRLVVVTGPAGIGKTRLAEAAVDAAHDIRLRVARGYAVAEAGAPPLWPWQRVLRGRTGTLAPADDRAARFQHSAALTELLRDEAEPDGLLLVLDDLHWADAASVHLLRHAANELHSMPLALVVTARGEAEPPWRAVLPDLVRSGADVVELGGLAAADLAEWQPALAADPARAEAVHAATGGNPLLVRLIANDLDLPLDAVLAERPQLRRLVAARVVALPPEAREVVEAASVLGERILAPILAQMTGRDVGDELELARRAGVLRGTAFEHALVRDAVYAELSEARRTALHRSAAEALETSASGLPGMIAQHWLRVGEHRRCLTWAMRADDAARAALAYDDAARHAELAVACARKVDDAVAQTLVRLAQAQLLQGFAEASAQTCVAAAAAARVVSRADLAADAALVVHGSGLPSVYRSIAALCRDALEDIDADDHARRARLLAQLATTTSELDGDPERAGDLAMQALAEAERCDDADAQFEAIAARHHTIMVPETVDERFDLSIRALAVAERTSRPSAGLWAQLWRIDAAIQLGAFGEVDDGLAAVDRIATTDGSVTARWHHLRRVAMLAALRGDFAQARVANAEARAIGAKVGDVSLIGLSTAFAVQLAILRGDIGEVGDGWEHLIAVAPPMPLVRITFPLLHAIEGNLELARAEFAEFRDLPTTFPRGVRWSATLQQVGVAAVLLDDADAAAAVLAELAYLADYLQGDGSGAVYTYGAWALLLGDLARVAGDQPRAIEHYRRAVTIDTQIGAQPFVALARLGWAQSLVASRGDTARARELVTSAQAEFERLDMPGPLRVAESVVRALGADSSSRLSAREREVADLVSRSMSNRDIAAHLVLSERTVETHVRNILTKLGFTSRTEIVAWVLSAS